MGKIDAARRSLPKMCCHYSGDDEVLIVKLQIGMGHQAISREFSFDLCLKLANLGHREAIILVGSGRFGDNRRHKEADHSLRPEKTRFGSDDWPTVVYEVGNFEALAQLRIDAHFWLTQSLPDLPTNVVVLIHFRRDEREMEIERWEVVNPQRPHSGSIAYHRTCECVQHIVLREGIVYTRPPLELPIEKVFDQMPPNLAPHELDYTAVELQFVSARFWRQFP